MEKLNRKFRSYAKNNPAMAYGIPFMVFMLIGTYSLTYFTQVRVDQRGRRTKTLTRSEERDLESSDRLREMKAEYQDLLKKANANSDFEQKRVKRPWEN